MENHNIQPEKITKPIQLLAAWLTGLIMIVGALLTAAGSIQNPNWLPALFGISAIVVIPLFLYLIFLLQTKYRPEMQEDTFYSKYLDKNSMKLVDVKKDNLAAIQLESLRQQILDLKIDKNSTLQSDNSIDKKTESSMTFQVEGKERIDLEALKKKAKYMLISLNLNKDIPKYEQLKQRILKMGFDSFSEFEGKELNIPYTLAVGDNVPIYIVKELVFNLIDFGVLKIKQVKPIEGFDKNYHIYVGSHLGKDAFNIDDPLIESLNQFDDNLIFNDFIKNNFA